MTTTADLVEDRIVVHAPRVQKDLVRAVPGVRYSRERDEWYAPVSWGVCQALRGVFGADLEISDALMKWAWDEIETRINPALYIRDQFQMIEPKDGWDDRLYSFQNAMVAFGEVARSFLNGSEMGLGKSVETAVILRHLIKDQPVLIVCNNTMKQTWKAELATWWPEARVVVIANGTVNGRRSLEQDADVFIVNWEALRSHSRLAPFGSVRLVRCVECGGADDVKPARCETHVKPLNRPWSVVIADEAHRAKDRKSKQTRALWAVGADARVRMALSGTPVVNAPDDLWSVLHFVAPDDWPAFTKFLDRYCMLGMGWGGSVEVLGLRPDTKDEFFRILDPRYKRDTKAEVLPQLPPKTYTYRLVEMAPKQAKAYAQMRDQMLAELDDGAVVVTTNPLAKATRLTQFACSYATLNGDGLELTDPSCKVDALVEVIEELGGKPAVVFAESRKLIELAAKRLTKLKIPHVLVTGAVTGTARDEAISSFQAGDVLLLLATLGAGGESITLTAADTAIFMQRSWSLVKNVQAEDRIHRIGQEADKIEIIDLVTAGTIEEHRLVVLAEKEERVREITRDPVALRAALEYGRKK